MTRMARALFGMACLLAVHAPAAAEELRAPVAVAGSGTVEVFFTPGDGADAAVIDAIGRARQQVLVQAFSFTYRQIAWALIAAGKRGVKVQFIIDKEQVERFSGWLVSKLVEAGIPVFLDAEHEAAHNKVMVIDPDTPGAVLITGSYNFSAAAQFRNAENLLLFRGNDRLTAAYAENWRRHYSHSTRFFSRPAQ